MGNSDPGSARVREDATSPEEDRRRLRRSKMSDVTYLLSAADAVRRRSDNTAVVFLYLPRPPSPGLHGFHRTKKEKSHKNVFSDDGDDESYLSALSTLTEEWPPTLMVRGVSPVTSITL